MYLDSFLDLEFRSEVIMIYLNWHGFTIPKIIQVFVSTTYNISHDRHEKNLTVLLQDIQSRIPQSNSKSVIAFDLSESNSRKI